MPDFFPYKKVGDSLDASHVNALSGAAYRAASPASGSYVSLTGGPAQGVYTPPPFFQRAFKITEHLGDRLGPQFDGLYRVTPRWWDHSVDRSDQWKNDADADQKFNELDLDAAAVGAAFEVGDLVVAYWDTQRGALVPVFCETACLPYADYEVTATVPSGGSNICSREISFVLQTLIGPLWVDVNGRYGTVDIPLCESAEESGTVVYSFSITAGAVDKTQQFRVNAARWLDAETTMVAGLRFEALCDEGIAESNNVTGLFPSTLTKTVVSQAAVNLTGNLGKGLPEIAYDDDADVFEISVPAGTTWTFKAELFAQFLVYDISSSSSTSQSSQSSSKSSSSISSKSSSSKSSSLNSSSSSLNSSSSSSSSLNSSSSSKSSSSSLNSSSSSVSSQSSSAYNCHLVVSDVTFNPSTCELTVCYKELCFGRGLDISVSAEMC